MDGSLGYRLRVARERRKLSIRDAAEQVTSHGTRISHVMLGNYERGQGTPSLTFLSVLAEVYGCSVEQLITNTPALGGVQYRCLKSVKATERQQYEAEARSWLVTYLRAEVLVARQLTNKHPDFKVERNTSGSELARIVRNLEQYRLGEMPLPSAVRLAENFGIRVIQLATNARIDAFAGWLGDMRVVVVNESLPNDRIRLSVLHELAHHLYEDCILDGGLPPDEIEKRAFEFASHMLIPDSQLENAFELKSMVRLVQYKERFGISLSAMIYRAGQTGLISKALYQRIWRQFGQLGLAKSEPGNVVSDRPVRMEAIFDAAVGEGFISLKQLADWVGVNEDEVHARIVRAMGGSVATQNNSGAIRLQDYF